MPEDPAVSFVIPSYRSHKTLGATLRAIAAQRTRQALEVLVVDSSGDDSLAGALKAHPGTRLIAHPTRLFPGGARNLGASEARGRWLAFIDADAAPQPDWLSAMSAALDAGAGLAGGWVANANPDTWASRVLHWIEFSESLPGAPAGPRKALSSSNWLIARSDFLKTGGFSEEAAMSEDLLFCHQFPGSIHFVGDSGIRHRHRETWSEVGPHLEKLGRWSGLHRRRIGSPLARAPWLAWGAAPWRAALIVARAWRADARDGIRCALHLPLLLLGLARWAEGLRKGLAGRRPER